MCSTAVAMAGASFFVATPAHASTTLAITGSTNVTTLNFASNGDQTAGAVAKTSAGDNFLGPLVAATYGVRVTTPVAGDVYLKLLSAPSDAANLYYDQKNVNSGATGAPKAGDGWLQLDTAAASSPDQYKLKDIAVANINDLTTATNNDRVYLTADVVGTYTFKFFEDVDGSADLSDGDNSSAIVTLTVKTPDDTAGANKWVPAVSAPSAVAMGVGVPATVDLSGLSLVDARGTSALGNALADPTGVFFDGPAGADNADHAAADFGGSAAYLVSGGATASGSLASNAAFDLDGDADWAAGEAVGAASTTVAATNGISAMTAIDEVDVTGSVARYGTKTVIKGGTGTATFREAATDGGLNDRCTSL